MWLHKLSSYMYMSGFHMGGEGGGAGNPPTHSPKALPATLVIAERLSTRRVIPHLPRDKMASYQLHVHGTRRIRDQDKPITSFYPGRLTTAQTRLEFVFVFGASTCSRWRPTSYMYMAHEGSEIRTNQSLLFTQVGLLQLKRH